jgi:hypothetical protein
MGRNVDSISSICILLTSGACPKELGRFKLGTIASCYLVRAKFRKREGSGIVGSIVVKARTVEGL